MVEAKAVALSRPSPSAVLTQRTPRQGAVQALRVVGATGNNLKGVTVVPVGLLTW